MNEKKFMVVYLFCGGLFLFIYGFAYFGGFLNLYQLLYCLGGGLTFLVFAYLEAQFYKIQIQLSELNKPATTKEKVEALKHSPYFKKTSGLVLMPESFKKKMLKLMKKNPKKRRQNE